MKKLALILSLLYFFAANANAQTATELLGKWKLVKWSKKGKEKDILSEFKTDQVFQVFKEKNRFISVNGDKEHKGKWKLSKDNKQLTIRSGLIVVIFDIDFFDPKKRVITSDQVGTLEYEKIDETTSP